MSNYTLHVGDCLDWLKTLPDESVQCCVTSPPYFGLRDYGVGGQIGLEPTPTEFVSKLVDVFREVRRVLAKDGTCWVNMGDSYAMDTKGSSGKGEKQLSNAGTIIADRKWRVPNGLKQKDLIGIPWRLAFALQADGWYLRQDIIWHKPNPMPESVTDRCTKAHEYLFLLTKSARYYWNHEANQEPATYAGQGRGGSTNRYEQNAAGMDSREYGTRNRRSVWTIQPASYSGAHFAVFPEELVRPCIELGSRPGDIILEPFAGSGTTPAVAVSMGRKAWVCELNPKYAGLIRKRMRAVTPPLSGMAG